MKRLKKIGLSDAYKNDETMQVVFRCLLALSLLPVADIDPAFKDVKALVQDDSASKTLLVQLCRYVERQWINKSTIGEARMSVRDNRQPDTHEQRSRKLPRYSATTCNKGGSPEPLHVPGSSAAHHYGLRDRYRSTESRDGDPSFQLEAHQLGQRSTYQGVHFPLRQRRVHTRAVPTRSESQCGRPRSSRRCCR